MEESTIQLLGQCSSGCKMAVNSIDQISEYISNPQLKSTIEDYKDRYQKFDEKAAQLLEELGKPEQEPEKMATAFSWITTEMKLMLNNDSTKISKIMMDGCNMGIQSISEAVNQYTDASSDSLALAKDMVKSMEDFMKELKKFL